MENSEGVNPTILPEKFARRSPWMSNEINSKILSEISPSIPLEILVWISLELTRKIFEENHPSRYIRKYFGDMRILSRDSFKNSSRISNSKFLKFPRKFPKILHPKLCKAFLRNSSKWCFKKFSGDCNSPKNSFS